MTSTEKQPKVIVAETPKRKRGRPRKDRPESLVQVDEIFALATKPPSSKEESEEKKQFRLEARKYAPAMLLKLVDLALHAPHAASQVKAAEAVIYLGHGRPSTVQSEVPPVSMVPNFTIVFTDPRNPAHDHPKLTIQAPFAVTNDGE